MMGQSYVSLFYVAVTKDQGRGNLQSKKVDFSHISGGWRTHMA